MTDRNEIDGKLDEILEVHRVHVEQYHSVLPSDASQMIEEHKIMKTDVSDLKTNSALTVELLAGKQILDPYTKMPTGKREPGIAYRVKELETNANGGRGLSVRTRDKIIIGLIASIPAFFLVVISVIEMTQ